MLQPNEDLQRWHWREMQLEIRLSFPTEEPTNPTVGTGWYDPATGHLYVWDGVEWVSVPED